MGLTFKKSNIYKVYYFDCDLSLKNLLFTIFLLKKVTAIKGRPCDINTFTSDENDIFKSCKKAVIGKKTALNTTNLGSRAGDKMRVTMIFV